MALNPNARAFVPKFIFRQAIQRLEQHAALPFLEERYHRAIDEFIQNDQLPVNPAEVLASINEAVEAALEMDAPSETSSDTDLEDLVPPWDSDTDDEEDYSPEQRPCRYGAGCRDHHQVHRQRFFHPPTESTPSTGRDCHFGDRCRDLRRVHRQQFSHPR
jgi:hypothetical protein